MTIVAAAAGSLGMTGGQSIDLASEGKTLSVHELRTMHSLKTGALLCACVMAVCELSDGIAEEQKSALQSFAENIGLAFQIRDDILDVEGETELIGKAAGADQRMAKATWPSVFGLQESKDQCRSLLGASLTSLDPIAEDASQLRWLARYIVERAM
jgi:geranylgeranyl pyrophosphate synthase